MPADVPIVLEISGESGTARVPVRGERLTVGRAVDNDVVVNNEPTVSRYHAVLGYDHDHAGWTVTDLGSFNGTHLNGERITGADPVLVDHRDVIGLGSVMVRLLPIDQGDGMTIEAPSGSDIHRLLTALSEREREVLALVAVGRTDRQVSQELYISIKTVHSHLDKIREKTGLRRRAELTRLAVRLGLSRPPA